MEEQDRLGNHFMSYVCIIVSVVCAVAFFIKVNPFKDVIIVIGG